MISDDGTGMSEKMLMEAMRPGSADPRAKRTANDLGRFGLGLKTASFSQCTQLTVTSKSAGKLSAAKWDLEIVAKYNKWIIQKLSLTDIENSNVLERILF